ncbi:MAG TPA: VOC family protein, partial [Myxococcota bacterium]|nr:VOC family protein [Myxococcota bacterium]
VEKLKAHGGAVYQGPFDVPSIGRVAIVADASGASFALYQPESQAPGHSDDQSAQGEVSWVELCSGDVDKAWELYADIGGWEKTEAMDMGPMGTYQMYGPKGKTIGGMMPKPEQMPVSAWNFYIWVDDLDAAVAAAVANGGTLMHGPHEVPGGSRVANLIDPQGAFFSLHGGAKAGGESAA